MLVVNHDEWVGFFDHVPPPLAPSNIAHALDFRSGKDLTLRYGFTVPDR